MDDSPKQGSDKTVKPTVSDDHLLEQKKLLEKHERLLRLQRHRELRSSSQREHELRFLQERLEREKHPSFDHLEHTDKSRKHIAFVFVYGYIIIVGIILIGVPIYNWLALGQPNELELEKTLAQIGALIGSPLGFVVGYYFKEETRK